MICNKLLRISTRSGECCLGPPRWKNGSYNDGEKKGKKKKRRKYHRNRENKTKLPYLSKKKKSPLADLNLKKKKRRKKRKSGNLFVDHMWPQTKFSSKNNHLPSNLDIINVHRSSKFGNGRIGNKLRSRKEKLFKEVEQILSMEQKVLLSKSEFTLDSIDYFVSRLCELRTQIVGIQTLKKSLVEKLCHVEKRQKKKLLAYVKFSRLCKNTSPTMAANLCDDCVSVILDFLPLGDLQTVSKVCKYCYHLSCQNRVWKKFLPKAYLAGFLKLPRTKALFWKYLYFRSKRWKEIVEKHMGRLFEIGDVEMNGKLTVDDFRISLSQLLGVHWSRQVVEVLLSKYGGVKMYYQIDDFF